MGGRGNPNAKSLDEWREILESVHPHIAWDMETLKQSGEPMRGICPLHGEFWARPAAVKHHGAGCTKCNRKRGARKKREKTIADLRQQCRDIGIDIVGIDENTKHPTVYAICDEHGLYSFRSSRLPEKGFNGCSLCAYIKNGKALRVGADKFIKRSIEAHGDKYDYSRVDYKSNNTKVEIICPKHGPFHQLPTSHMNGHGCPRCAHRISKWEQEVCDWVVSVTEHEVVQSYTGWSKERPRLEIDIYIPALNLGIECHGTLIHSEKFHKDARRIHRDKYLLAKKEGIRLVQMFSHEWVSRQPQIKSFLLSALKANPVRLGARQCRVVDVDKKVARRFLERYHIQGAGNGKRYLGLVHDAHGLVLVAQFGHHHRGGSVNVLQRFCGKEGVSVAGGLSRVMKAFGEECITWSDNRWSAGVGYAAAGFVKEADLLQDYSYVTLEDEAVSKQSQKKSLTGCPPDVTEREWAIRHELWRWWDSGKVRWRWALSGE